MQFCGRRSTSVENFMAGAVLCLWTWKCRLRGTRSTFVDLEMQISRRRSTLWALKCKLCGRCTLWVLKCRFRGRCSWKCRFRGTRSLSLSLSLSHSHTHTYTHTHSHSHSHSPSPPPPPPPSPPSPPPSPVFTAKKDMHQFCGTFIYGIYAAFPSNRGSNWQCELHRCPK